MATNLVYSRLGSGGADFQQMINRFGVVTVMNARVYEAGDVTDLDQKQANAIIDAYFAKTPLCRLDTLKIANATQEGPTKTVTGGQYSNPLIKFGKTMRLEMQDALGSARALDALCGTVSEMNGTAPAQEGGDATLNYNQVGALHVTEDFNGPKCIIGDTFFIDQKSGQQIKAFIIFYQFLPDSIFNLTQDAEGDATVFDMNGDVLTTNITIKNIKGQDQVHGTFYSIVDPAEVTATPVEVA
jgi:hypothetical protein